MTALILAAGLGTRLKPWTDHNPKALVEVRGVPMLERVINNLQSFGFDRIIINAYHFADKIIDFVQSKSFKSEILISDERPDLLDTGGGVLQASVFRANVEPLLVHNVDILCNADLRELYEFHLNEFPEEVTLLISDRDSSRRLIFDGAMQLKGWHGIEENKYRPEGMSLNHGDMEFAFSGIYVIGERAIREMDALMPDKNFRIMDYLLRPDRMARVKGYVKNDLNLIDIGKPATLLQAQTFL